MMAMTTSSSIKVKPLARGLALNPVLILSRELTLILGA